MVEKAGHKKRVQLMRMEWINEGKPRSSSYIGDMLYDEPALPPRDDTARGETTRIAPIFEKAASARPKTPDVPPEMEDLYDATPKPSRPAQNQANITSGVTVPSIFGAATTGEEVPPEDDLDALLAEEEMLTAESKSGQPVSGAGQNSVSQDEDFLDDMDAMEAMDNDTEAMAAMNGMW